MSEIPKARALSDEELITRAIRAAFPRPGPWLPYATVSANVPWPSSEGIAIGERWEVYVLVSLNQAILLNDNVIFNWSDVLGIGFASMLVPVLIGMTYDPTIGFGSFALSMATEGWLLSDGAILTSTGSVKVRARRRFDLE